MNKVLDEWLEGRPDIIRDLAYRYPPGTKINIKDKDYWVMAYNENGSIRLSAINPWEDYDGAIASNKEWETICSNCLP